MESCTVANGFRILLVILTLLAALSGCSGGSISTVPVALIPGIQSRQSPEEIQTWLGKANLVPTVIEKSDAARIEGTTRLAILKWSVIGFPHEGVQGELQLMFLNEELMSVWFYPDNPEDASSIAVFREIGMGESEDRGALRSRVDVDFRGRIYVAYEDVALVDVMDRWLEENS